MSSISNSEQTNATRPDSYTVEKVHLFTNLNGDDQFVDLTFVSQNIIITEGISTMGISLDVTILDAAGILEGYKVMGNEKVLVQISRHDVASKTKNEYILNLRIANIGNYSRLKDSLQTFTLTCVSDYVYNNNLQTITNHFEGSIGVSIKNLCGQLKINEDDLQINEETNIAFGVYPRLKPLSAIKWLLLNATDAQTPFFFYQRIADNKIVLESYKDMVDKEVFDTYRYAPFFSEDIDTKEFEQRYEEERKKITTVSSDLNISQLRSVADGAYGSTLHTIDIATKKYSKDVDYSYTRNEKLNPNDSISDNMKLMDKPMKDHKEGKNFFVSQNSLAFDDGKNKPNYSGAITKGYLNAHSYLKNLNTVTLDITIAGDFTLKLGDKINVDINRAGSDSKEIPIDVYLSGNYIITKIVHKFAVNYSMILTIQKDSFTDSIDDIIKIKDRPKVT